MKSMVIDRKHHRKVGAWDTTTNPLKTKGFTLPSIPDHPPSSFGSWRWSGMGVVCVVGWGWWWCVGGGLGSVVGGKGKGRGAVGGRRWLVGSDW